jgi:hypothetical protein
MNIVVGSIQDMKLTPTRVKTTSQRQSWCQNAAEILVFLQGDQGVVLLGGEADFQNPEL